jgi:hypothetical protein
MKVGMNYGYSEIFIYQLLSLGICSLSLIYYKIEYKLIPYFIFLTQLIICTVIFNFYDSINLTFGFDALDAFFYEKFAKYANFHSLADLPNLVEIEGYDFTDWGYPAVRMILGLFSSDLFVQNYILVVFNCFIISLAAYRTAEISKNFFSNKVAALNMTLIGLFPYSTFVATSGLKENVFMFIVVSIFYYFYKYKNERKKHLIIRVLVYIFLTIFFRWYLTIFLVLTILFRRVYTSKLLEKKLLYLSIFLIISSCFFGQIVHSENNFIKMVQSVQSTRSNGAFGIFINFISTWIGPFPSFIERNLTLPVMHSVANFIKLFFSLYFLIGSYYIFKTRYRKFYPILIFTLSNMFMVSISNSALDMRYIYITIPYYFIICYYGLTQRFKIRKIRIIEVSYISFCCLLIITYNLS